MDAFGSTDELAMHTCSGVFGARCSNRFEVYTSIPSYKGCDMLPTNVTLLEGCMCVGVGM